MTSKKMTPTNLVLAGVVLTLVSSASAIEVEVNHENQNNCDFLFVPTMVDELGVGFPSDELIRAQDDPTELVACAGAESPNIPNAIVEITNLTQRRFTELWYVSDPETMISNSDGFVNNERAFRIDTAGVNRPLIFESGPVNGVFDPGEVWQFIIDDYLNMLGLPASAMSSQGLVGSLSGMDQMSSGSIIAVPEPGTGGILVWGLVVMLVSNRRRHR